MKHYKLIGLISSIILIFNYIVIGPAVTFVFAENWFDSAIGIHRTFVFPLAFMGFYFALYKVIQKFEIKRFTIPVLIILGFGCLALIFNLVRFIDINTSYILSGLPGIVIMIVFIIWSIQVIRNKDDRYKRIRRFAIAMLAGYTFIFIFTLGSLLARSFFYESGYQPFEFTNIAYVVYGIGYVFGLLIFVEKFKTNILNL